MKSETFLDKAVQDYNFSVNAWNHKLDDEAYLNNIGYFLQQSVELAMKYTLEKNGVEYAKTHDIEQLLYKAHKSGIDMHAGEYIEEHAEMLTSWEAKTRYVVDYRIEMHKIEDAIEEVGEYLERLRTLEVEEIKQEEEQDSVTTETNQSNDKTESGNTDDVKTE